MSSITPRPGMTVEISMQGIEKSRLDAIESAEALRKVDEAERAAAEVMRKEEEAGRITAEQDRALEEYARELAESGRMLAEENRVKAENQRAAYEQSRVDAEKGRSVAEANRVNAEQQRVAAETSRANAEAMRQSTFEINEANRQAAFNSAETHRASEWSDIKSDVESSVGSAVAAASAATDAANTAAENANAAAEKSVRYDVAQALGDAHKAQARGNIDAADISDVNQLKYDLSDFKDLADFVDSNADSKDTLYIVDTNGKIIAKISKDGIDTVGYKKHGEDFVPGSVDILETYDDVFYIADGNGNVIFKASKYGIEGVNISASSPSPYKDKVLISIGDSLSAHDKWQKWLVEWWGCTFDDDANVNGKDGHSPMAKGGTAVIPNSVDSIYIRALDAHYYNPDVIILYAGQNDVPHFGSATEVNSSAVGTIDDVPYKKTVPYTELEESEYSDYTSWYEGRPTLYSYCMGLIENLLTSCPKAQIIVLTPMQMWTSDGTQSVGRKQLVTTWHNICDKYALPIVDLWNKSGVNVFNMIEYYPNAGNVHPNDYGYKRIAETIYSEM